MKFVVILFMFLLLAAVSYGRQLENKKDVVVQSKYDSLFNANDWRAKFDDEFIPSFGNHWRRRILSVGDTISTSILGEKIINDSGIAKFTDYNRKLIILDFWATWCGTCMASLPHIENLQNEFNDQIQIILINFWETEEEIKKYLVKHPREFKIPIVLGTKDIMVSFPTQSIPYHVWIDSMQVVRLMGTAINTHSKKISDLLNGKSVTSLKDENLVPHFVSDIPYYKVIGKKVPNSEYYSFFTLFNSNYASQLSGSITNLSDIKLNKKRNTFVNFTVLDLYKYAYKNDLRKSDVIFSPYYANIIIDVNDTSIITNQYINYWDQTEMIFAKSKFCYEQIAPITWSEEMMKTRMKVDLDKFFDSILNLKSKFDSLNVMVKKIERVKNSKESSDFYRSIQKFKSDTFAMKGSQMVRHRNISVGDAIKLSINGKSIIKQLKGCYIVDGLKGTLVNSIILPVNVDLDQILYYLDKQGFDIKVSNEKIPLLVFTEKLP